MLTLQICEKINGPDVPALRQSLLKAAARYWLHAEPSAGQIKALGEDCWERRLNSIADGILGSTEVQHPR